LRHAFGSQISFSGNATLSHHKPLSIRADFKNGRWAAFDVFRPFSIFNEQRYGALPLRAQVLKIVRLSELYRFSYDQWKRR
jgi:hypothetical protein